MRGPSTIVAFAALGLAPLLAGCATSRAPGGFLPSAAEARTSGRGGWITVQYRSAGEDWVLDGELLAVEEESVYVLTREGVEAAAIDSVTRAELWGYRSEKGRLALWTLFGTLGTASHGAGLIITAPVWILAGTLSTAGQSRIPRLTRPDLAWAKFRPFARFPQGLPPGLDRSSLEPYPHPGR